MTSAITSDMLATMRGLIESDLLPDTCTINTMVETPDGEGGVTTSGSAIATAVPCRLDAISGREQVSGGAIQAFMAYKLSLPYDQTIAVENQVVIGSDTFTVTSVNDGQSWKAVTRVDLEKL